MGRKRSWLTYQRDFAGDPMIEARTFGRVWRLWVKPWSWPYAFHSYGLRCAGIGPLGFMLFDAPARSGDATKEEE